MAEASLGTLAAHGHTGFSHAHKVTPRAEKDALPAGFRNGRTIDVKTAGGNQIASCNFIWKAGEKYFANPADTPDTLVRARQFKK